MRRVRALNNHHAQLLPRCQWRRGGPFCHSSTRVGGVAMDVSCACLHCSRSIFFLLCFFSSAAWLRVLSLGFWLSLSLLRFSSTLCEGLRTVNIESKDRKKEGDKRRMGELPVDFSLSHYRKEAGVVCFRVRTKLRFFSSLDLGSCVVSSWESES